MTDEQIERVKKIKNVNRQVNEIYNLLDEIGMKYKKTGCSKCRKDLLNILREEAGLIEHADEVSDFNDGRPMGDDGSNKEFEYLLPKPQFWQGHRIDQDTPTEIVRAFVAKHPTGYYRKIEK